MDLTVRMIAAQTQAGGSPEGEGALHGAWAALVWEMEVAGCRSRGGARQQLAVHPDGENRVRAQVGQQFF